MDNQQGVDLDQHVIIGIYNYTKDKLHQHRDNLALWESGVLTPTEPSGDERAVIIRELKASISELEQVSVYLRWAPSNPAPKCPNEGGFKGVSPEMVKCVQCGWQTHYMNPKEHSVDDARIDEESSRRIAADMREKYNWPPVAV